MSGANRPSGPATRKSLDLADQIERDELENNLPDALNPLGARCISRTCATQCGFFIAFMFIEPFLSLRLFWARGLL
jgi:hypothetical protein